MTDVIVVEEGEHSSFGPSSAERVINCPGSVNASVYVTDSATTYSALGTCKHHIAYLARLERCSPFKWLGRRIRSGEFEYTIDEEFCDEVEECVEYSEEAPGVPLLETRVAYSKYVPGGFGTLDDARIAETLCTITDYKFGKGHQVWAENNSQLKLYALGVIGKVNPYVWLTGRAAIETPLDIARADPKAAMRIPMQEEFPE